MRVRSDGQPNSRYRASGWALACLTLASIAACSLAIDLPADCEDTDCAPFVCAADRIACVDTCATDQDCIAGYVCDAEAGVCASSGCEPAGAAVALRDLPASIDEFAVDVADNPEQLIVLLGRPQGLGLSRFAFDGNRIPDPIDEVLGALPIAGPNEDLSPFEPQIRSVNLDGAVSYRFVWRSHAAGSDRVEVAGFDPANPGLPIPEVIEASGPRTLFDSPHVAPIATGGEVVDRAFWRTTVEQSTTLSTDRTGAEGVDAARLTDDTESVASMTAGRYSNAAMVAAAVSRDGLERLDLLVVAPDGTRRGVGRLEPEQPAQQFQVSQIEMAAEGADWLVLWHVTEPEPEARLATFVPDEITALVGADGVGVESVAVGRELEDVRSLDVTWRDDQIFVAWDAEREGERNLYVTRYDKEGAPVYAPFAALEPGAVALDGFQILPSADGVDLVWRERRDSGDGLFLQRYLCTP